MVRTEKRLKALLGFVLVAAALAAFWPAFQNGFINYDDPEYVTENPLVRMGLTGPGLGWAFTTIHAANWHPLTWVSHMTDVSLFGLNPAGHHATNVLLHILNSLLLFSTLRLMTGALWRSALVAALFTLHPAHVQSVVWVAERKDVLSSLFFLLTIWSYVNYARTAGPIASQPGKRAVAFYALAILCFILGLMSKPMLVTLPFVLLLIDFWPLRRAIRLEKTSNAPVSHPAIPPRCIWDKLPFLLLAAPSCVITLYAQKHGGALAPLEHFPLTARMSNAIIAYVTYLGELVWPARLAIYYPHPGVLPIWQAGAALGLLALITATAILAVRRFPFLFTGWFWYLGTLVPVIGIVQVGSQAMADRYTYLPFIGLLLAMVWGAAELLRSAPKGLVVASAVAVIACGLRTNVEARYWRNSETLFRRALAVTRDDALAHFSLGKALADKGRHAEAQEQFETALRIAPTLARAHGELARLSSAAGNVPGAISHYETALKLQPELPEALNNLAWIRATDRDPRMRDGAQAVRLAERACELTGRERAIFLGTLAAAYAEAERFPEAVAAAEEARHKALQFGEIAVANRNLQLLELYRQGRAYREPN